MFKLPWAPISNRQASATSLGRQVSGGGEHRQAGDAPPLCEREAAEEEHIVEWPDAKLNPDVFGFTVCSLVHDCYCVELGRGSVCNRVSRIMTTLTLLFSCIVTQVFLLQQVTIFVAAKGVHDIRIAYSAYEQHMYENHTWIVSMSPTVEHRGRGKTDPTFHPELFETLDPALQEKVCSIPFTQPLFIYVVLYIWTLTCTAELRACKELSDSLIQQTDKCENMIEAFDAIDVPEGGHFVVARLTTFMKGILIWSVIVPRFCTTCYLVWIGSRWLLSTTDFSDLILNSVGLEFILALKDIMYLALVPRRSMLDLENTRIKPTTDREPESLSVFIGTMGWSILAGAWVLVYMGAPFRNGFQQVLRGYNWDVALVCAEWVKDRYAV